MSVRMLALLFLLLSPVSRALDMPQVPLLQSHRAEPPPLNLLLLSRDHKLFVEAYDDASDLDGDGLPDVGFKPDLDYYGYFNPGLCYRYSGEGLALSSRQFVPVLMANRGRCGGSSWSGNLLNYIAMSRIDILRRSLYGGKRDGNSATLLRSNLPADAHAWGREFDGSLSGAGNLLDYVPADFPIKAFVDDKSTRSIAQWLAAGHRIMFANMDMTGIPGYASYPGLPVIRVAAATGSSQLIDWVSSDGNRELMDYNNKHIVSLTARVAVCTELDLQLAARQERGSACQRYGGQFRPIGLLHTYGMSGKMEFGLMSSSYDVPMQGGVLRVPLRPFSDEVDGHSGDHAAGGIVKTIDALRINKPDFMYYSGSGNWGNPLAEMYYEALRYLSGAAEPVYITKPGAVDAKLSLPSHMKWHNPYAARPASREGAPMLPPRPWCTRPFITVISDAVTSFDTNVPGSAFGDSLNSDLPGLNVNSLAQTLWRHEFGAPRTVMVGAVAQGGVDGLPTGKQADSFNIRGIAPEEPTRQGSFYSAMLAYYARTRALITPASPPPPGQSAPLVHSFAVAISNALPRISLKLGPREVSIVPYGKAVHGVSNTLSIVDFYLRADSLTCARPLCYRFRVNFDDAEDGGDYDKDAVADYQIRLLNGRVQVSVDSVTAASGSRSHLGFIITGVRPLPGSGPAHAGGGYLVVRENEPAAENECVTEKEGANPLNFGLVARPEPGKPKRECLRLPLQFSREFEPDNGQGEVIRLASPLWYLAKYGGYADSGGQRNVFDPAQPWQWDADGDGVPDNYAMASNPLKLEQQLERVFQSISHQGGAMAAGSVSSMRILQDTLYYESSFDAEHWSGDLKAYRFLPALGGGLQTGNADTLQWSAAKQLDGTQARVLIAGNPGIHGPRALPFRPASLRASGLLAAFRDGRESDDVNAALRVEYLAGSAQDEGRLFRYRPQTKLGDLLSSAPLHVGRPFNIVDSGPDYAAFRQALKSRPPMVYIGGNDGMLHAFDAGTGREQFAFVPKLFLAAPHSRLLALARPDYGGAHHRDYVNGQQDRSEARQAGGWASLLAGALGSGGRELYLLDVTRPEQVAEGRAGDLLQWEFTGDDDADLGLVFGRPRIVRLNDGQWHVLSPNGYNSGRPGARKAGLFILPVTRDPQWLNLPGNARGSHYFKLMTSVAGENGLSDIRPVDLDRNGTVDLVYAGDLRGNVWKFDLSASDPALWHVARDNQPLFTALGPDQRIQPIVVAPAVAWLRGRRPQRPSADNSGLMVYVGTGKFIENCDRGSGLCGGGDREAESARNSIYGLWDFGGAICSRDELRQQQISSYVHGGKTYRKLSRHAVHYPPAGVQGGACLAGGMARQALGGEGGPYPLSDYRLGWFEDLPLSGERVISAPVAIGKQVLYLSYVPDVSDGHDVCRPAARSFLMAVSADHGGALDGSSIVIPGAIGADDRRDTAGVETAASLGYTLFDVPAAAQAYGPIDKPYLPFAPGYHGDGCANTIRTSGGDSIQLAAGAECRRHVRQISWREIIKD